MKHSLVTENDIRGKCCPIVREHVALVASLSFLLHWESNMYCMVAICPFRHNNAGVMVTMVIMRSKKTKMNFFIHFFFFCNHACLSLIAAV